MLDYSILKIVWWVIIGIVLIAFSIMDGHDMGVGTLLPFIGKTDEERRVVINSIAPHWDGNQVWLIVAGAGVFAAWPIVYSISFSGLYWAMLLLLFALFFRPVGLEYRSKIMSVRWRRNWDLAIFVGSVIPSLLFGVAFGNLFLGIPFHLDENMRSFYTGNFFELLHPFALLCGVVSLSMLMFQGSTYLLHRTEGALQNRIKRCNFWAGSILLLAFSVGGICVCYLPGPVIQNMPNPNAVISPLMKTVTIEQGALLHNFREQPELWLFPIMVYVMILTTVYLQSIHRTAMAFLSSSLALFGVIVTAGMALFPFVLPSSTNPNMGITLWDGSSSYYTLVVMLIVVIIFVPCILVYTSLSYRIMRGKLTTTYIKTNDKSLY